MNKGMKNLILVTIALYFTHTTSTCAAELVTLRNQWTQEKVETVRAESCLNFGGTAVKLPSGDYEINASRDGTKLLTVQVNRQTANEIQLNFIDFALIGKERTEKMKNKFLSGKRGIKLANLEDVFCDHSAKTDIDPHFLTCYKFGESHYLKIFSQTGIEKFKTSIEKDMDRIFNSCTEVSNRDLKDLLN